MRETTKVHRDLFLIPISLILLTVLFGLVIPAAPQAFALHFNPYALISLAGFVINSVLLVILIRRPNHTEPVLWLALFIVFGLFWSGAETMERMLVTPAGSYFWGLVLAGCTSQASTFLYLFVRGYTAKVKSRGFLIPILLIGTSSAIGIMLMDARLAPIPALKELHPWGYTSINPGSLVIVVWALVLVGLAIARLVGFYRRAASVQDRHQAAIFIRALSGLLVVAVLTESILPNLGVAWVPPMGVFTNALVALAIIYGIQKYGSLTISPADIAGTVLGNMAGGVVVTDLNYRVLYGNQRAAELFSPDGKDLTGRDLHDIGLRAIGGEANSWEQQLKERPVVEVSNFELGQGDQVIILNLKITKLQTRQPGYVFVMNDVTEQIKTNNRLSSQAFELANSNQAFKHSQAAMLNLLEDAREISEELKVEKAGVERKVEERTAEVRSERARLESSINSLDIGFYMVDTNLKVIQMNQAAHRVLRTNDRLKEVNQAGLQKLIDSQYASIIRTCLKDQKPFKDEAVPFGDKILKVFVAPVIDHADPAEPVLGAVVVLEDVTDAKALERSRDEFFSIASHELRTPLTAIRGNTSMIQDYYGDQLKDPSLKEMISDIHDSSIRLIMIVNDFLNTSRLEQGKIEFKIAAFNTADLIDEVIKEFKAGDSGAKVPIVASIKAVPNMLADRDRIKEVLINLIGNAVKFTDTGTITVSLGLETKKVKLSITDTGKGIPKESQILLFRKFQQASNNILTRDNTRSTGLGLYISKLIITGMNGEIFLEHSEADKGSTFTVLMPGVKPVKTKPAIAKPTPTKVKA